MLGLTIIVFFLPNGLFAKQVKRSKKDDRKTTIIDNVHSTIRQNPSESEIGETGNQNNQPINPEAEGEGENKFSFKKTVKLLPILLKNKVFILSVLGLSALCFVIQVIQFWGSDYMENVLKIEKARVNVAFIIVCLTAPTLGVLIGGAVTSCLGGYEKIGASYLCLLGAFSATLLSIPIPFMDSLIGFTGFLYGVLVFGGMIFPSIYGKYLFNKNNRSHNILRSK